MRSPYIPTIDRLELQYKAEETVSMPGGSLTGLTRLYHISPVATETLKLINREPFALVDGPTEEGFLQFVFTGAEGYDTIRMYVDLLPSHHEFDKSAVTRLKWFYNDGTEWKQLEEEALLIDETDNFLNSGIIELKLPVQIPPSFLDSEGCFWLCAAFDRITLNYPGVYGIYMNTLYVEANTSENPEHIPGTDSLPAGTINSLKKDLPGVISIRQIRAGYGGLEREPLNNMLFRASNQVQYRKKPTTPEDYECIVLERFPHIDKVKCFSACDTKNMGRKGVVTLAVMQKKKDEELPLCSHDVLFAIEKEISTYVSPFVTIDAINPIYEEVMVRCNIRLKPGVRQSLFMRDIKEAFADYIAPWLRGGKMPVFGQTITAAAVEKILEERPEVLKVHDVSLIVLEVSTQREESGDAVIRKILEITGDKKYIPVAPSYPWHIQIPTKEHLVFTGSPEEYTKKIGTGELGIDNTFIIKA